MKTLMNKTPRRSRLGTIGNTVSTHTSEAGHKIREEFDDVAPKVAAAASDAVQTVSHVTHVAAERSRPVRAKAAYHGSAALSGLLGDATPDQIKKMSGRAARRNAKRASAPRSRGRTILLVVAAAGGAVIGFRKFHALWTKRSDSNLNPWLEEVPEPGQEPAEDLADPRSS